MTEVKMTRFWQGSAWSVPLFEGLTYDLPDELAEHLVAVGRAEVVEKSKSTAKRRGRPKSTKQE